MFPALLFGQFNNNTTSPYSRYGIGDLHDYSFGRTSAMGGAAIASRYYKQINLANPASYNAIDSLGFMFELGINGRESKFKNDLGATNFNDINFQYLAMNFRVNNHIAAAFGLKPFSDVGYDVRVNGELEDVGGTYTHYYGVGTISTAFFGLAVKPIKNLSIGANLNYSFGMLNQNTEINFLGGSDFYLIQQYKSIRVNDFGFEFGTQVTIPLSTDKKIILGAVLENKPKYKAYYSNITQKNLSYAGAVDEDTLSFTAEEKGFIEIPVTFGIGISYVKVNKLEVNADYFHQAWGSAKFFGEKSTFLTDLNKFAIGAEWIPDKFSIRSYLSRVSYRFGGSYKQTYLIFNDQHINDYGITFGVGLPIYRSNSTIDVAVEFGRRGTTENNLVLENYTRLNVSINLYDLWFIKRKFD